MLCYAMLCYAMICYDMLSYIRDGELNNLIEYIERLRNSDVFIPFFQSLEDKF